MANKPVEVTVKVNSKTGELDVAGSKLKKVGKEAKKTGEKFGALKGEAGSLLKGMLGFASAGAVFAFFKGAVAASEEEADALKRLRFSLDAAGISWDKNSKQILSWIATTERATKFTDTEATRAFDRFARLTGDVEKGMKAAEVAMGLSVTTGKSLATTSEILSDALNGEKGAVTQLRREFGSLIGETEDLQEIVDTLSEKFGDAAFDITEFQSGAEKLKQSFGDLKKAVGGGLAPALSVIFDLTAKGILAFRDLGEAIGAEMAKIFAVVSGTFEAIGRAVKFDFSGAKQSLLNIKESVRIIEEEILADFAERERAKTEIAAEGERERTALVVKRKASDIAREEEEEAKRREKEAQEREKLLAAEADKNQRILDLQNQLSMEIFALDAKTFEGKKKLLAEDIKMRRDDIKREIKDDIKRRKALDKLDVISRKRQAELDAQSTKLKTQNALTVASTAVEALQTINSMSEVKTKNDARRAKLILSLEKAIAIARAIAAAAGAGPAGIAIAAAQVALITAQFAAQAKAISRAQRISNSSRQEFKTETDLGAGQTFTETRGGGPGSGLDFGSPVDFGGGEPEAGVSPSGFEASSVAAGGGRGRSTINVGGVVVNFSAEHVDLSEIETVMRRIREAVQQGTVEGVQMAIAVNERAGNTADLAV